MNKIYVKSYLRYNLGDDLFLKIFSERYPNTKIYAIGLNGYSKFKSQNIKFKNSKVIRLLNIITKNKNIIENRLINKTTMTIILGGSMFIENKSKDTIKYTKPYYVIGSNFGPFKSKAYYNKYKSFFKKAEDVCFREKYSYKLFNSLGNIRYAPDIVFSMSTKDINISNSKRVVISVINPANRDEIINSYYDKIIELIKLFNNNHYEITLMSFCKKEGDEKAIKNIIKKIGKGIKVKTYFYRGNIKEAINVLADSQIIVGSRFHANVLGLILNKTIIPIAYSDKTINFLKDLDFQGIIFDARSNKTFNIADIKITDLQYKIDIRDQRKKALKHFKKIDEQLK